MNRTWAGLWAGAVMVGATGGAPGQAPPSPAPLDLSSPTLFVVPYAHLDTQWRWNYVDTIGEYLPATMRDNFNLFERYPGYVFNFTGSRRYQLMQEYYPEDFARLKTYAQQGRWFPAGSSVDEHDANMPSAESIVRQVLYANRYFKRELGLASEEYMLPDSFGFPASLPSVLAHAGIKGFSTQKLTWGLTIGKVPFPVGVWNGPDGRGVIAALDPGSYVGRVREDLSGSRAWLERVNATGAASGLFADFHYYGTGDIGGAPDEESVRRVERSLGAPGPLRVAAGAADWLFRSITAAQRERLPRYQGDLELTEHSAGSLTSQAYMKRWNRRNELLADAAERAAVLASLVDPGAAYPREKFERAWTLVLGSQMHDMLPGTATPKAISYAWNDEALAANQFAAILTDAAARVIARLDTSGPEGAVAVVVYNPLGVARQDVVVADLGSSGWRPPGPENGGRLRVVGPEGEAVPSQVLADGRVAFLASLPPVGLVVYQVTPAPAPAPAGDLRVSERELENEYYLVRLDQRGDVASIFDKKAGRELLAAPARLELRHENPRNWPAWNQDWADRLLPPRSFAGADGPVQFKVVERGPARVAVEVTREGEGSWFVQVISLAAGDAGRRVEFDTSIDWRTRERSLRAAFPLAAASPTATFNLAVGTIERPIGRPEHFEYLFHQWIDQAGVSLLADGKYGSDKPDQRTLRLTLLHTPGTRGGYIDQSSQDLGRHRVRFAVYGHGGEWRQARAWEQAARLEQPLIPFVAPAHPGALGRRLSLAHTSDPSVTIGALKQSEDGQEIIVRVREQTGRPAAGVRVEMSRPIVAAREVDGQEREIGPTALADGVLAVDVGGYELRAYALRLAPAPAVAGPTAPAPVPLDLPLDTDVVTARAESDGAMSTDGGAYPAEQWPAEVSAEGARFRLGPSAPGAANALSSRGQTIALPPGEFDTLYLLLAGDGADDVPSALMIDDRRVPFTAQAWRGVIGQWDRRVWGTEVGGSGAAPADALAGLDPGFIKAAPVAWFNSHHHRPGTPRGDAIYEYCYLFKMTFDLPPGARSVRLPDDPRIKVFAGVVTQEGPRGAVGGPARVRPAAPLFDTMDDHAQDAPRIVAGDGRAPAGAAAFDDAVDVRIEPTLYGRRGAIRFTTDGSAPGADSPAYTGALTLHQTATVRAVVVGLDGRAGPGAGAAVRVNDMTPPRVLSVTPGFGSTALRVEFSEPVDERAAQADRYALEPPIEVRAAQVQPEGRGVILRLARPPAVGTAYTLRVSGVGDRAPAVNTMAPATFEVRVRGPVYDLPDPGALMGQCVRDVPGLPVKAGDAWTINVWVKAAEQPQDRTIIAGFGRCEQTEGGNARYLSKFSTGIHFWSHNRDVPSRTALDLGRWQMLSATYDGGVLRLYKDGVKIAERQSALSDDENVVCVAPIDPWDKQRRFTGELRAFTIWASALDDDAVASLAAAPPAP